MRIFTAGAVLAVVGMYLDERWMTGAAILVLLGGFFLRFLPVPGPDPEDEVPGHGEPEDEVHGGPESRGPGEA